jgi:hypothetical protein
MYSQEEESEGKKVQLIEQVFCPFYTSSCTFLTNATTKRKQQILRLRSCAEGANDIFLPTDRKRKVDTTWKMDRRRTEPGRRRPSSFYMLFLMEKIKKELKKIVLLLTECKDCELSIREIAAFFEKGKIGKKIHRRRRRDRRKKRKSRRTTRFRKTTISSRRLQGVHGGATLWFTQWKNALFTGSG